MPDKLVVVAGGTGKLGRLLVRALLDHTSVRVRVLARDPRKPEVAAMASERVEVFAIDVVSADETARTAALTGAFAVVSTLQGGPDIIIETQRSLLRTAKAVGARRFIPSDYSYNLFSLPEGININSDWRRALANHARAEGTPTFETVHVMQGIFADREVLGFLGMLDPDRGIVRYWGDGQTPIDWTTWEDTARFTAAAALDDRPVPPHLFVSGDRKDLLSFASTWEAIRGRRLTRERLGSLDDLAATTTQRLTAEPVNMYAWLPLMYARGVFGGQALLGELHNARYPGLQPETLEMAIRRGAI